jgi:hypothetical protein
MTKRYPVGDGSFCYVGPTCRRHGASISDLSEDVSVTPIEKLTATLEQNLEEYHAIEQGYMCTQKPVVKEYPQYSGLLIAMAGAAGRFCEEHDGYHIYSVRLAQNIMFKKVKNAMIKDVRTHAEDNRDIPNLIKYAEAYYLSNTDHNIKRDLDFVREHAPEEFAEFVAIKEAKDSTPAPKVRNLEPLKKEAHERPEDVMLRWYQCFRKQNYPTAELAKNIGCFIDTNASVYSCVHCGNWHIGHGEGDTPVPDQLVRAREIWYQFPDKANRFVESF